MANLGEGNLLSQVKVEPLRRPQEFYWAAALEALTVLLALGTGYAAKAYLVSGAPLWHIAVMLAAYLSFSALVTIWTRDIWRRFFVLALESLSFVAFFYDMQIGLLFGLWVALYAFFAWGELSSRRVYENTVEFRFMGATRPKIMKAMTGIILGFVIVYPIYEPQGLLPSQIVTENMFAASARVLSVIYPTIDGNATVDSLVRAVVESKLANDPSFTALSRDAQEKSIAQSVAATESQLGETLGFAVRGDMPASELFSEFINTKFGQYQNHLGSSFLIIWMVIVFFIVRSFAALYYIGVAVVIYVIYQILIAFDVIHIASESRAHEFVEFSKNF